MSIKLKNLFTLEELQTCAEVISKKRKFSPGFDKMTPEAALTWLKINGDKLCNELNNSKYKAMPASGFNTAKFDGGYRSLAKLTVIDTIIQKAVLKKIEDSCDAIFSDYSFAYRKKKGTGTALLQYIKYAEEYPFAVKLDLKNCFENIDFDILEKSLQQTVDNNALLSLLMEEAKMPVLQDGITTYRKKGILQGAPLSGLFCNIYLHTLDKMLEHKNIHFIRYADDIVIFGKTSKDISALLKTATDYLSERLMLPVNKKKIYIAESEKICFLGSKFFRDKDGTVTLNTCTRVSTAYYDWYRRRPLNNKNSIDLLSDGILRQKDFSAVFDTETEDSNIPLETADRINIFSNVILDSGFLEKAQKNGVYINIFNRDYSFVGRFIPFTNLKDQRLLFDQLTAYNDIKTRLEFAKQFDLASVHNLRLNIRYYNKQNETETFKRALEAIDKLFIKMKQCEDYNDLLMIEATCRHIYYSCFDAFIADSAFIFQKRTKMPPENEVNSMLSFGNVVLYNYIATEIYKSPLDIRVGYLHATNNRLESLNLDVAEIFRPLIVDRVVFSLINRKAININHFTTEENGAVYLNEDGKRIFLRAFYDKLSSTIKIDGKYYSYSMLIEDEIRKLVRCFRKNEKYKAYRQVR